jgi:hypothetical protein
VFGKKTKKITFQTDSSGFDILKPIASSRMVPEWFRKTEGAKEGIETLKKCIPILDSLTAGYMIRLPADMTWIPETKRFFSMSEMQLNSDHNYLQTDQVSLPPEFDPQPHKWVNSWFIKTPPGYSTLFIHPLNQMDLPFHSFSGIVDTDRHPLVINFPFVLRKDFSGTIPAGTPIIQAIPFKRDEWDSEVIDNVSHSYDDAHEVDMPPFNWYKRKWWTKKVFR